MTSLSLSLSVFLCLCLTLSVSLFLCLCLSFSICLVIERLEHRRMMFVFCAANHTASDFVNSLVNLNFEWSPDDNTQLKRSSRPSLGYFSSQPTKSSRTEKTETHTIFSKFNPRCIPTEMMYISQAIVTNDSDIQCLLVEKIPVLELERILSPMGKIFGFGQSGAQFFFSTSWVVIWNKKRCTHNSWSECFCSVCLRS
jgi:hypothetical protein